MTATFRQIVERKPWVDRDADLAAWAFERCVNRADCWGGYIPIRYREPGKQAGVTKPPRTLRGKVSLNCGLLAQHFRGASESHIIGTHAISRENTSLWGLVDVDRHGDGPDESSPESLWAFARTKYDALVAMRFHPLLTDSNGKGGYHLRILFAEAVQSGSLHRWLLQFVSDFADFGLREAPEVFPKQVKITAQRPYGNWARLPGRHHTRDHWTRVWDGSQWIKGEKVIDFILSLTGDDSALMPFIPPPAPKEPRAYQPSHNGDLGNVRNRARLYLSTIPPAVSGQRGHNRTYYAVCRVMHGFCLSTRDTFSLIWEWNQACEPPWDEADLWHKIHDAENEEGERGFLLNANRHATDNDEPDEAECDEQEGGEQPPGQPYFTSSFTRTLDDAQARKLAIVVGGREQAIAVEQCGYAAIALPGVRDWAQPRPKDAKGKCVGERQLLPELAAIEWQPWRIGILFESGPQRNPSVNYARAELARVLTNRGANVVLIELPIGQTGDDGLPAKIGADDFILRFGAEAFRQIVERAVSPPAVRPLAAYREDLQRTRLDSIDRPGLYLDRSPTGAGKSFSGQQTAKAAGKSLTILQTHAICQEVEQAMTADEMAAAAYPKLSTLTCRNFGEADRAQRAGLSVVAAVCPTCQHKTCCEYHKLMEAAGQADHRIATHHRASLGSLAQLADGATYIEIHEDATNMLRPVVEISAGLADVAKVAEQARFEVMDKHATPMMDAAGFLHAMEQTCQALLGRLSNAEKTELVPMPHHAAKPSNIDAILHRAMQTLDVWTNGDVLRVVRASAAGELADLGIRVDRHFDKEKQEQIHRAIVAVWQTTLPEKSVVWLVDATAPLDVIERMTGRPVFDATPTGHLERKHPVLKVAVDVKKSSAPATVVQVVTDILNAYPSARRVGIVCDRRHKSSILGTSREANLDPAHRERIAKVEHFRGPESRASNQWTEACDLLLVVGTPRIPSRAIETHLIQTGQLAAAARGQQAARWERDYWSGITTSGKRRTITTKAYRDHFWHEAHKAKVHAELLQCVGRARSICDHGIPCVVASCEDLGFPLAEFSFLEEKKSARQILDALKQLSEVPLTETAESANGTLPYIYIRKCSDNAGVPSSAIAAELKISDRWVRKILGELESFGRVRRVGQRGGWLPIDQDHSTGQTPLNAARRGTAEAEQRAPAAASSCADSNEANQ